MIHYLITRMIKPTPNSIKTYGKVDAQFDSGCILWVTYLMCNEETVGSIDPIVRNVGTLA